MHLRADFPLLYAACAIIPALPIRAVVGAAEGGKSSVMRWFRINRAEIDPELRELFEERGLDTVRLYVAIPDWTMRKRDGTVVPRHELRQPMMLWLKEQYDWAEIRETWLITMEIAITVFVAAELFMSILDFVYRHSK